MFEVRHMQVAMEVGSERVGSGQPPTKANMQTKVTVKAKDLKHVLASWVRLSAGRKAFQHGSFVLHNLLCIGLEDVHVRIRRAGTKQRECDESEANML